MPQRLNVVFLSSCSRNPKATRFQIREVTEGYDIKKRLVIAGGDPELSSMALTTNPPFPARHRHRELGRQGHRRRGHGLRAKQLESVTTPHRTDRQQHRMGRVTRGRSGVLVRPNRPFEQGPSARRGRLTNPTVGSAGEHRGYAQTD